jgi:hypothetical protein
MGLELLGVSGINSKMILNTFQVHMEKLLLMSRIEKSSW